MAHSKPTRLLVIGLDCAAPEFLFGQGRFDLPQIRSLIDAGSSGTLESCYPPITVPAWSCMTTGKDPGTLGCYGFRNRRDRSYAPMRVSTSADIKEPRIWDILSDAGRRVVILGVPQTYPPTPLNGCLVSGILTPDTTVDYTYPPGLKLEIEEHCEEYLIDVEGYRCGDKAALLDRCYALMHNRFDIAEYLIEKKTWDFFMMVEMGIDRMHHGFWSNRKPSTAGPENPYAKVLEEYYQAVDERIGDLLARAGTETAVMLVSDHGAKALHGGFCINQWLIDEGLLTLRETPAEPTRLEECRIDWPNTKVWSTGGYYARLFFNLKGREPEGAIRVSEYAALREHVAEKIEALAGPEGKPMQNRAYKPEEIYRNLRGVPPDLIVYLSDLHRRSIGMVGMDTLHTTANDTGPDEANHAQHGIIVIDNGGGRGGLILQDAGILDIAPTILRILGLDPPRDMQGKSLI